MRHYAILYAGFLAQHFKGLLEFRASFFIGAAATVVQQAATLLTIWIVMRQIPSLKGWTLPSILLIYGLLAVARALNQMFTDSTWDLGSYVRNGGFDRFLVRPVNPLFHLLANRVSMEGLGNLLVGAVLVVSAGRTLGIFNSAFNIAYTLVAILSGAVIFSALNLLTCTSAFWLTESIAVSAAVFENHRFAYYPLPIYPRLFIFALTWVIPYAFASYYPAQFLLGRDVGPMVWLGPVVAAVFLVISYRVWLYGLRHYQGTGS